MPAFKRFGPGDQIDNVLILEPRYDLVSGSQGWRGSPEGSASLSLYGGARRRPGVFSSIAYQSFAPNVGQTGSPRLGQPLTASVNLVYVTDEALGSSQVTSTRWGEEHWDVVQRLYQDYRVVDADYVTSSYDYYCLYFNKDSLNVVVDDVQSDSSGFIFPSASFTVESWIKPFATSSATNDFTVQSMNDSFWFGVTGSSGRLKLSSSLGVTATSSFGLTVNRWNHVAFSYDSTSGTGSFFVNLAFAGNLLSPSASLTAGSPLSYLSVGNRIDDDGVGFAAAVGSARLGFHGLMGESRYWDAALSVAQMSAGSFARLTGSAAAGPIAYLMFNEGPLVGAIGTVGSAISAGSGAVDYAGVARARRGDYSVAKLSGFDDRVGPVWHPNDNVAFFPTKRLAPSSIPATVGSSQNWGPVASSQLRRALVVDVPSAFYGRRIVPGSVRMTCRAFEGFGLVRTLVDDGRGGLYLSGSVCSSSLAAREEYAGVGWNKVGNVFYGEGLVVVRDPALLDFGRTDGAPLAQESTLSLSFRGDSRVPVKTLMCRIDHGEFNCTNNRTFLTTGSAGERLRRHPSGSIRATTVGIYNSDRELVAVARLADPVRIRARDRLNLRLRIDF